MIVLGIIITLIFLMVIGVVVVWDDKQIKRQMDEQMREFLAKFEIEEEKEI